MSRSTSVLLLLALAFPVLGFEGVGRKATPEEIAAWDIDVRADFKGLPKGAGSVKKGEEVWEAKCTSCHGPFGDSNTTFPPIAGGVTKDDIARGRVAALARPEQRTTMMKLSQLSALWDYINRAMPWNEPKTLSVEEVYAVTAYILSLDGVVPEDFVLSDRNIAEVQKRLPNRNGLTREHGLWDAKGRPDVQAKACMANCAVDGRVTSRLPEDALPLHGNLAEQQRTIGPVRGMRVATKTISSSIAALAEKSGCMACHAHAARVVGPSLAEIAQKYRTDDGAEARLFAKVRDGGKGTWGEVPMPPHPQLAEVEIRNLVRWFLTAH
jgi:cytochrome c551/c552/cytochrome c553